MGGIAAWLAPMATMIAAIMTAANLGAKVTGWGFVIFTMGSICWSIVAIASGQQNLLWTNGFLTLVNAIGIWRWLGRRARYDERGAEAIERSATTTGVPTLFAVGSIAGRKLLGRDGEPIATVIEAMMHSEDCTLAYLVVSEGGVAGVGERLHAMPVAEIGFSEGAATCDLSGAELAARPILLEGAWPVSTP